MGWLVYVAVMLALSALAGWHVGRFRASCSGMVGMMVGMTMGMTSGFVLGYGAAAATNSMFWGNIFGILLGLTLGVLYGRWGGLMGMIDGGMGGVMGGSMGAMLAVMIRFPNEALIWTAVLLTAVFMLSMLSLSALVEQHSPDLEDMQLVLPVCDRLYRGFSSNSSSTMVPATAASDTQQIFDYYALLGIGGDANDDAIYAAYEEALHRPGSRDPRRIERALTLLGDPRKREVYDWLLEQRRAAPDGVKDGEDCPDHPRRSPARGVATERRPALAASVAKPAIPAAQKAQGLQRQPRVGVKHAPTPLRGQDRGARRVERIGPSKGSLVVGVCGAIMLLVALTLKLLAPASAASLPVIGHDPNDPNLRAVTAPIAADGRQTLDLVVSGDTMSYQPDAIKVKQGAPVRLNLSTAGRDPGCGRLVMIYGIGASASATPGQVTPLDFTPTQAGTYEINCGMKMMAPGYLIVTN